MATRISSDPVPYDHGAILRRIPAGTVRLSALDDGTTHVDAFLIDAAPVTVRRYARFFARVGRHIAEPLDWATQVLTPDAPVTGVAPDDAAAFAAAVGGRLPTVWEWQRVARSRFTLAPGAPGELFGVTGLCERWEWTQTPAPTGFWVCGGRYRDRPDDVPDVDHLAFESRAAADIGFRVARDLPDPTVTAPAPEPEPLLLDEPTQVTARPLSSTAPEGEVPAPAPPPPPPSEPPPPPSLDETLAAPWSSSPRAAVRCGDVVIVDNVQQGRPIPELEHRAVWRREDGDRWPVTLTAMWPSPMSTLRLEARLMWHALRGGPSSPIPACAFHVVDAHAGIMPVVVERTVAGVPLHRLLNALAARRDTGGVIPFKVAIAFVHHIIERGVLPVPVVDHESQWGRGLVAWDGTWHPRFDVAEPTDMLRLASHTILDMAPERMMGQAHDDRASAYRTGLLLYRLLAGARPWSVPAEPTTMDLLRGAVQGERIPLRTVRPDVPADVAAVIDDAVAIHPERRPGLPLLSARSRQWLEPSHRHDDDDVVTLADTTAFMAGLLAELFPRTRAAQLQWWDEVAMVDVDGPLPTLVATPLPAPAPSEGRFIELLADLATMARHNDART